LTTPAYQRERGRLAEALKALRVGAGLSGARLAEMLGWQQSKVSKIETRKQLPAEEDISAWVSAAGGSSETASEVLAVLRGARVEYAAWKDVKGHQELPGDGHGICPLVATRSARWRPPDGLRVQVLRGITPFPARAWDRRMLSPAVWQTCA